MTICFFSAQYLPTVGGVERYTYNLAKRIMDAGHKALVVTSALPGLPDREVSPEGIEIFRLPAWLFMNGRFPVPKPGKALQKAIAPVWEQKIDLCVINARFYVSSLYAARQCKKRGIPAILIEHSTSHLQMGNPVLNAAGNLYEHMAAAYIHHYCPRFFGVSQTVCRWLEHFHIQAEGTLYNSVEPDELLALADAPNATDWRARLGLAPDTRLVVFVGRLIPEKGIQTLIDAFTEAAVPNSALVAAGDGPLMETLQKNCPANVYLAGAVPYAETLQLLRQGQLYCLPTFSEGFATTFLEAAACGCPIITTPTGGSNELLPDDRYGLKLPEADAHSFALAIRTALADDAWQQTAAQLTEERLRQHFTCGAVAQKLLDIAKASANNKGGASQC